MLKIPAALEGDPCASSRSEECRSSRSGGPHSHDLEPAVADFSEGGGCLVRMMLHQEGTRREIVFSESRESQIDLLTLRELILTLALPFDLRKAVSKLWSLDSIGAMSRKTRHKPPIKMSAQLESRKGAVPLSLPPPFGAAPHPSASKLTHSE